MKSEEGCLVQEEVSPKRKNEEGSHIDESEPKKLMYQTEENALENVLQVTEKTPVSQL